MAEFRTGLEGKPWYMGVALGLAVAAIIYGGVHYFSLKGQRAELARQESRLGELQRKIQEGRAAQAALPRFREEVRQLELELDQLLRILPARRNTQELLRRIRALTEQGDFNLLRFTPGGEIDRDFYSEWPITISLTGTYHNLALLFDRVSRFSRIINIEGLKLDGRNAGNHTLSASFRAKTFIYKDPPPEADAEVAP
ncbi:MAG: type 4a pilus biogenesis protein PilO [Acidobacteriota bacterium]|nr:type 4a pilus biogenesis protein PilO [Acidobacteriota bacterium]MDH3523652.1 type 4a pilus biogenesis protein PilO [Acidobacteriota bacterium]